MVVFVAVFGYIHCVPKKVTVYLIRIKYPFLKQLLLRNCVVDFVEICKVYIKKMIKPLRGYLIVITYAVVIVI